MPTERESFLKGIRTYCERNNVSQYAAALCEKAAEYAWLHDLNPEAFERGFQKVAQYYDDEDEDARAMYARARKRSRGGGGFNWKPWLIGGAALAGGIGIGTMYGRHAQRTGNPYGFLRGGLIDVGEFLTGKDLRYHPEKALPNRQ